MKTYHGDVVIVGSGVAGIISALAFPRNYKVLLITTKRLRDSNSYLAQGGICVQRGEEDRESFIEDTLRAGHYENFREAVEVLVEESRGAIQTLIQYGVPFSRNEKEYCYTREGGHSKNRILYCDDITGKRIMEQLVKQVRKRKNIRVFENTEMTDLIIEEETCFGVQAFHKKEKRIFFAKNTILACGGIGGIYSNTTNFSHIAGDGIVLATKYGISLKDISYVQIHPTTFYEESDGRRFLISESVRGEGALLYNHQGKRFVDELQTRDVVTQAILQEMKREETKYEFLDFRPIAKDFRQRFPNIYQYLCSAGKNPFQEKIPIVPSQHYTMGGIDVDLDGKTSLSHLYAVGEVACTGVHGKNRLASNSLLESVVFGKRAAVRISLEKTPWIRYNKRIRMKRNTISNSLAKKIILERIKEDEDNKIK